MSQLQIAQQLRKLASDVDSQTFICQEKECMKGLLNFLDSSDDEVLVVSLQALQFLSTHPANQPILSEQPGLLLKLATLSDREDEHVKKIALTVLENLEGYINGDAKKAEVKQFKPRYLFHVPVYVEDMETEKDFNAVEGALINVKGVVSISIEKKIKEVNVYSTRQKDDIIEEIVRSVGAMGFTPSRARAVRRELRMEKENAADTAAGYLDSKPKTSLKVPSVAAAAGYESYPSFDELPPAGAMTQYAGISQSSLQAKYKIQKKQAQQQEEKKGAVRSLFGAVTSFFW